MKGDEEYKVEAKEYYNNIWLINKNNFILNLYNIIKFNNIYFFSIISIWNFF